MENAAKALTMAAEILIAILILTLAVYAFVFYSDIAITYEKTQIEQEIQKFNSQFTKYIGQDDIRIQEIVTLVHIAQDYNRSIDAQSDKKYDDEKIDVEIKFQHYGLTEKEDYELIEFIKDNSDDGSGNLKRFKCEAVKYNDEGKIYEICFVE